MKITPTRLSDTLILLNIGADNETMTAAKDRAISSLGKDVKVQGFRAGKAPTALIEKAINPKLLQEEFLNEAINHAYGDAVRDQKLNPVARPKVEVTKFVPYTTVEFTAEVSVIGKITLGDYKKLTAKKVPAKVTIEEVEKVLSNMQLQLAEKKDVERAAVKDDQVWINFDGKDARGVPVKGAKGEEYPLVIGSNTFIPGFEDHIVGLKPGNKKTFDIVFPKDYSVKALQSKKVTFDVEVTRVQEVVKPELNDVFVKKVAPNLSSMKDLKADIEKQLLVEAEANAQKNYENALVNEIVEKSDVRLPEALVEQQAESVMRDLQQNILYRGQTYEEYLEVIGMTADEQRAKEIIPEATRRLKGGVILGEIADKEGVALTPEELDIRLGVLRQRYQGDPKMLEELGKKQNRQEVGGQVITDKTIAKIVSFNS